ncbi:nuclear transport factor 2 family protein [Aerophototrophica crusticola]|uniref:Nuclear transport factor 2 family protein n=1 Tax=Aerophototrophica crusticola TaxID=1709002 RepID=A0A858RAJ0_9PROT|nr:nuclear transport factor 2 family protein [Rhodospirillaceae bacterium B3]
MGVLGIDALLDRQAIQDCLARYCRGMDQKDRRLLASAYWPEAQGPEGVEGGLAAIGAAIEQAVGTGCTPHRCMHKLGNVLIRLEGDRAEVESYVVAYHWVREGGVERQVVVGGRYLDRFERRDGDWRIAERRFVLDWNRSDARQDTAEVGLLSLRGALIEAAP